MTTVTKFPERSDRGTRIVERGTLLEKGFSTVGTKLIHVPGTGTHIPGTWNVALYHVPGDYDYDATWILLLLGFIYSVCCHMLKGAGRISSLYYPNMTARMNVTTG
jgi:hypothetical protein